jgi:hypothetical protein
VKYRKKPVVIEAERYEKGMEDGFLLLCDNIVVGSNDPRAKAFKSVPVIQTLEGPHQISPGDYIITGIKGERYPCKPDIFELTYEPVGEDDPCN